MTFTITATGLMWFGIAFVIYFIIGLILGSLLAAAGGGVEKKDIKDLFGFALSYGWIFGKRLLGF